MRESASSLNPLLNKLLSQMHNQRSAFNGMLKLEAPLGVAVYVGTNIPKENSASSILPAFGSLLARALGMLVSNGIEHTLFPNGVTCVEAIRKRNL